MIAFKKREKKGKEKKEKRSLHKWPFNNDHSRRDDWVRSFCNYATFRQFTMTILVNAWRKDES